jgi:predicted RNase H-like HicB family nuclease
MAKRKPLKFVAIFRRSKSGGVSVDFPDLPECVSSGVDLCDARMNTIVSLASHLETLRATAATIPTPRNIQEILDDPEVDFGGKLFVTQVAEEGMKNSTRKDGPR